MHAHSTAAGLQTAVVGVLKKVVSVDVPFTSASSVATSVSAYTVSPSACTLREAMPAMVSDIAYVNNGGESVAFAVSGE